VSAKEDLLFEVMPVDVFVGGCGHIVLCQEWPDMKEGETYLRVLMKPDQAESVCQQIMAMVAKARGS
jgi:hypothetical protein